MNDETVPEMRINPTFSWAEADMLHAPRGAHFRTVKEISGGDGVVGAPSYASSEKGEKITELVVSRMSEMLHDILEATDA